MSRRLLNVPRYRGFEIGWVAGPHGVRPCWRSSLERGWHDGHMYVDRLSEVERLAHDCIDFQYRKEAIEAELGRELTIGELGQLCEEH